MNSKGMLDYLRARWLRVAAALVLFAAIGAFVVLSGGSGMESADEEASTVRVLTGGVHTVYHSTLPLPSADRPQPEGRATLVWFSATWCTTCASMDSFAADVLRSFEDRLVIVEKSVDHDRGATERYGIRGTPTFVLIDAAGKDVSRFNYVGSAEAFRDTIEKALAKL